MAAKNTQSPITVKGKKCYFTGIIASGKSKKDRARLESFAKLARPSRAYHIKAEKSGYYLYDCGGKK